MPSGPILPGSPAKPMLPFPVGSSVYLRSCPHGQPGRVQRMQRGRVVVHWEAWNFTGRYQPSRLMEAK